MTFDPVNRPSHYTEGRKFETIEVIEDWDLGFCLGNAVKYISRAGRKSNQIEDLKKAVWYVERQIEALKAEEELESSVNYDENLYGQIVLDDQYLTEQEEDAWAHVDMTQNNNIFLVGNTRDVINDCDLWDPNSGPIELTEEEISRVCHGQG